MEPFRDRVRYTGPARVPGFETAQAVVHLVERILSCKSPNSISSSAAASALTASPRVSALKKGADLVNYIQTEVADRGIDAIVSTTGCLNVCEKGPVLIVYPNAWWYHEVDEAKVDAILDALEQSSPVEELLMA